MDPTATVPIRRTGLSVTRLGLGGGPLAGLFEEVTEDNALATVRRTIELRLNLFDTAPLYGHGLSEIRMGRALREFPRDSFVLATKVGRSLEPLSPEEASRMATSFHQPLPFRPVFDFSADAIKRSLEGSLERLGLDRVDIVHVHDPDDAFDQAVAETFPVLARLREQGVIRAVGAGMNQSAMLTRLARECDFDCFLLAGRYTLLDQSARLELLPLCEKRGIAVILGGPFNTGILATGAREGARFDYTEAPPDVLARVARMEAACARHGVPLRAAALQFPLRHPAVCSVIPGCRSVWELEENLEALRHPIPGALWEELKTL